MIDHDWLYAMHLLKRGFYYRNNDRRSSIQVYCGPCFSNAPAPSALPMPAFREQPNPHLPVHVAAPPQHHQQPPMTMMIPPPMKTAYPLETTDLSEIQRGLWSMLKISA